MFFVKVLLFAISYYYSTIYYKKIMKITTTIAIFAILSSIAMPLYLSINQVYAAKTCGERGLDPNCLPGQHFNEDKNEYS